MFRSGDGNLAVEYPWFAKTYSESPRHTMTSEPRHTNREHDTPEMFGSYQEPPTPTEEDAGIVTPSPPRTETKPHKTRSKSPRKEREHSRRSRRSRSGSRSRRDSREDEKRRRSKREEESERKSRKSDDRRRGRSEEREKRRGSRGRDEKNNRSDRK